jgi:uncharacterized damage-inducible protein DinB
MSDDLRPEHARREAEAWEAFRAALDRIPRERWEGSDVLPGWSVKELLWHMAGWLQKCARNLERFAAGEEREPSTGLSVDELNDLLASEAREMSLDAIHEGLLEARDLVLERWTALPQIDDVAVQELADETYEHYDEHRADLERFPA